MKSFRWCFAVTVVLLPITCYGTISWEFEDDAAIPQGWSETGTDGGWAIEESQSPVPIGAGKVLRAELDLPAGGQSLATGAGGDLEIDARTPEFRFQDINSALLDFDFDVTGMGVGSDPDRVGLMVTLHKVGVAGEFLLWRFLRAENPTPPALPLSIVQDAGYNPVANEHADNVTVYQIRMRVFDGDAHPLTLVGAEVDNLNVTSTYLTTDYNRNGVVDTADYVVWRDSVGQSGMEFAADGNGDRAVNQADYTLWAGDFGMSAVPGAGSSAMAGAVAGLSVPEPRPVDILAVLVIGLAMNPAASRWFERRGSRRRGRLAWDCRGR